MPSITVVDRSGAERMFEARVGNSVMETIRDGGVDELLALCGGCCSCATCHVHVAPEFFDRLEPISEDEDALLDGASDRGPWSRLSCQLRVTDELAGLRVTVANED